jgi:hypothetical protein
MRPAVLKEIVMNRYRKKFLLPLALLLAVPAVQAAQVEVNWENPDSFRDIQPSNDTRQHFRDDVLADLEAHFKKAGEALPSDQTLVLKVTDVDLAGYVEYFYPDYPFGVRVIRDIDFPRLALDYELKDADGNTISTGSEDLKDMNFRFPTFNTRYTRSLNYEKNLIDHWYRDNFPAS